MQYEKETLESLTKTLRKKNPNANIDLVERSVKLANEIHAGETYRNSSFVEHLLTGAGIIAKLDLDEETVCAIILHNSLDNGKISKDELTEKIGKEIATMIEEFKKINEIEHANFGKIPDSELANIILGTITDIRTLFVKFAAKIDALRHLESFPKKEQNSIASPALTIYAPICHKLGIYELKWELEDLAFKKIDSENYYKIKEAIGEKRGEREKTISAAIEEILQLLKKDKIEATIYGRPKSFYSIFKKTRTSGKEILELPDLLAIRILCNSLKECYEILGIIHSKYDYLPQFFDDYIANPKPNGYKSIHTTIKFKNKIIEVQIRTWDMHKTAEDGLATHWQYKQHEKNPYFDKELSIAKEIVNWQQKNRSSKKLAKISKLAFDVKKIFVFTPKKEVIVLAENSTPIDFAFAVHSDVGKRCAKAKVNGKTVPLDYRLQNGDNVEILTSKKTEAKRQWLYIAQTEKAKTKIRRILGITETAQNEKKEKKHSIKFDQETIRIAKCCNPVPGDEIVGYRTTKRKIIIHRKNCKNSGNMPKKAIKIDSLEKSEYNVRIKVKASDYPGLLPEILNKIVEKQATIISTNTIISEEKSLTCIFTIKIRNLMQLEKIIEEIETMPEVNNVERL